MSEGPSQRGQELAQQFVAILKEEQDALTANNIEAVVRLTEQKLACAEALETFTTPTLINTLSELRSRIQSGQAVQEDPYYPLFILVEEANRLNKINGVVIEQHIKTIRLAMDHLDRINPGVRQLYGKDGLGSRGSVGRSLGSA
jgi:flagellar biosynthesis/type III secretory pathway chaperone